MSRATIPRSERDDFLAWLLSTGWSVETKDYGYIARKEGYVTLRLYCKTAISDGLTYSTIRHPDLAAEWKRAKKMK
jgi:hypothetical protein